MAQALYQVIELPESGIAASAAFHADHLDAVCALLDNSAKDALAIVFPPAGHDHKNWRLALARDLARAYAPVRVNVVGAKPGEARETLLEYLENAKAVTGHYLESA